MKLQHPPSARLLLAALGLVAGIIMFAAEPPRTRPAQADTTNVAVIACENIAPYLDGNPNNVTTQSDLDLACKQPLPPTGALSIATLETAIGTPDGHLTYPDLIPFDALDNNRIPADCTYAAVITNGTKPAAGCTLLVFVFVNAESPVTLDVPSTVASIETGGDAVCSTEGSGFAQDNDCSPVPPGNGDGVVVYHVLNATAADGTTPTINVTQQAVTQSADIHISSLTRNDPAGDIDNDGVPYPQDNCPFVYNPDQLNTDNAPIVTPGVAAIDTSIPNGDNLGDACDPDKDNDGLYNDVETAIGVSAPPAGGSACNYAYYPGGTNPLVADTDGDRVLDGAECVLGSDPTNPASLPPPAPDADHDGLPDAVELAIGSDPNNPDTDGDGITDGVEFKGYNTSPTNVDTDGDGCSDGREIASVDSNPSVNALDLLIVAQHFADSTKPALDINKDGIINVLDLLIVAREFGPCPDVID